MGVKVTIIVEVDKPHHAWKGKQSVRFESSDTVDTGRDDDLRIAAHTEHKIVQLGAEVTRQLSALFGDHRNTPSGIVLLYDYLRERPLSDYLKARRAAAGTGKRVETAVVGPEV